VVGEVALSKGPVDWAAVFDVSNLFARSQLKGCDPGSWLHPWLDFLQKVKLIWYKVGEEFTAQH
jgi:hypothetical protein